MSLNLSLCTLVRDYIDTAMREMGEDKYKKFLAERKLQLKDRERETKKNEELDELRKKFPKHLYKSDEEESDYEVEEKELYPTNKRK